MALDKTSPVPLYYQLVEVIRDQIQRGELAPGDQLPGMHELSKQYGISRMTALQAVRYLVREGILVARHGHGTFVVESKLTHDALHLLSFTEEIMRRGGRATSRVLNQTVTNPPLSVAAGLRITARDLVMKIVRLRLSDDIPLLLETIYLPAALCPGLERVDLTTHSLYTELEEKYGMRLTRSQQTVEATIVNDYESQLLGIAPGSAILLLEGTTYDEYDRPVEYFKAVYRGDRFKFSYESTRNGATAALPDTLRVGIVLD
jgi:GntR family transcriptional regulator